MAMAMAMAIGTGMAMAMALGTGDGDGDGDDSRFNGSMASVVVLQSASTRSALRSKRHPRTSCSMSAWRASSSPSKTYCKSSQYYEESCSMGDGGDDDGDGMAGFNI